MFKAQKSLHEKVFNQQITSNKSIFRIRIHEGTQLRDHLDQLNTVLLELWNIDVKVEDDTNYEDDIALVVGEHTHHNNVWILDSRESYHIRMHKE